MSDDTRVLILFVKYNDILKWIDLDGKKLSSTIEYLDLNIFDDPGLLENRRLWLSICFEKVIKNEISKLADQYLDEFPENFGVPFSYYGAKFHFTIDFISNLRLKRHKNDLLIAHIHLPHFMLNFEIVEYFKYIIKEKPGLGPIAIWTSGSSAVDLSNIESVESLFERTSKDGLIYLNNDMVFESRVLLKLSESKSFSDSLLKIYQENNGIIIDKSEVRSIKEVFKINDLISEAICAIDF